MDHRRKRHRAMRRLRQWANEVVARRALGLDSEVYFRQLLRLVGAGVLERRGRDGAVYRLVAGVTLPQARAVHGALELEKPTPRGVDFSGVASDPALRQIVVDGLLDRAFHDAVLPKLLAKPKP